MDRQFIYPRLIAAEGKSISMEELSTSIEEIVCTPDQWLFTKLPDSPMSQDFDFNSQNITMESIKSDDESKCYENDKNYLDKCTPDYNIDYQMQSNSQNLYDCSNKNDTDNNDDSDQNEFKNNNDVQMQNNFIMINPLQRVNTGLNFGALEKTGEKLIQKFQLSSYDLINVYCPLCNKTTNNYMKPNCIYCQTKLLFQCSNCKCVYKKLISIKSHIKYDCHNDTVFYCSECDYSNPVKIQLMKHIQNEHITILNSDVSFNCSKCNKKFKKYQNKLAHEKMCGLEPILQCKYCFYRTKTKRCLTIHVQLKHPEHDPQNYHFCPECGKKYIHLKSLNKHIKTLCGRTFLYECDHCDYKVNTKYQLAKHMQKYHPELYFKNKFMQDSGNKHKMSYKNFIHNVKHQVDI